MCVRSEFLLYSTLALALVQSVMAELVYVHGHSCVCSYKCECAHVYGLLCLCMCMAMCAGAYGGQRSMLAILPQQSSALSFEDRITHLGLMDV